MFAQRGQCFFGCAPISAEVNNIYQEQEIQPNKREKEIELNKRD